MRQSAILLSICLGAAIAATAGEAPPERAEVDGKEGYIYGNKWYRLLLPAESGALKTGVKGCAIGKAADAQGDIVTLYPPWDKIPFKLGVVIKKRPQAGENLWFGGEIRGEGDQRCFQVEALAVLPSDLALAKERWQEAEKKAQPEFFFRIAWDLEQAEHFLPPDNRGESTAIAEMIERCYGRGLELEEKDLTAADDKALAQRLARYRQAVARADAKGNEGLWGKACQEFMRCNAQAADALATSGKCEDSQRRQLIAGVYFLLAKMRLEILQDKETAQRLLTAAAGLSPSYPGLTEQMRRLGLKPLEKTEAKAEVGEKEDLAKRPAAESDLSALAKWQDAKDVEKKVTVVDALLSQPSAANIADLTRKLDALPLEIARYALWQAAFLEQPKAALPLWTAALSSKVAALRRDAMAFLLSCSDPDAQKTWVEALAREKDAAFLTWVFETIRHLPKPDQRVDVLIQVLSSQASRTTRQGALAILEKETGQSLGLDHLKWQEWWQRQRRNSASP